MALPAPAWRVKTRPCPFYQQGRCLFADSCNFLHAVSVKTPPVSVLPPPGLPGTPVKPPLVTIHSPTSVRSPHRSPRFSGLLLALKDVIGEDPDDEYDVANEATYITESVALQDDFDAPKEVTVIKTNQSLLINVIEDQSSVDNSGSASTSGVEDTLEEDDDDETLRMPLSFYETQQPSIHTIQSSPDADAGQHAFDPPETCDLLSPVDLSHLNLIPFNQDTFDTTSLDQDSIDSGYADTWKPPYPLARTPPRSPLQSTFGLLSSPFGPTSSRVLSPRLGAFITRSPHSPFDATSHDIHDHPPDLSLDSPEGDSFQESEATGVFQDYIVVQEDIIEPEPDQALGDDYSYEATVDEVWTEEDAVVQEDIIEPYQVSGDGFGYEATADEVGIEEDAVVQEDIMEPEPNQASGNSFDYETTADEVWMEEDAVAQEGTIEPEPELDQASGNSFDYETTADEVWTGEDVGVSNWTTEEQPTAVYLGNPPTLEEVGSALERFSTTPTHFLADKVNFVDDEATGESTFVDSSDSDALEPEYLADPESITDDLEEDDPEDADLDYTARLAYLSSPLIDENDTLHSIYAEYSAFSPDPESPPVAVNTTLSTEVTEKPATPTMLIRERVFTPPPTRDRSGTIRPLDASPSSVPSPPVSFGSLSQGRASPHSQSVRSAWSPDSLVSDVQEEVVSKKIPFGFRRSLVLGRSEKPTLVSNRMSKAVPPGANSPVFASSQSDRAFSPESISPTSPVTSGLRPLRLSTILGPKPSSAPSRNPRFSINRYRQSRIISHASMSSTSVSSDNSLSNNPLLSSARSSSIPEHIRNTLSTSEKAVPSPLSSYHLQRLAKFDEPRSAPLSGPSFWSRHADEEDLTQPSEEYERPFSRFSEPSFGFDDDDDEQDDTNYDRTIRRTLPVLPHTAPITRPASTVRPPMYAIATPKPTLMFAIASDNVEQVRQVLESGDAGPNDPVGPQSALTFALTNDQLTHKMDIVKTLLAFGADPTVLTKNAKEASASGESGDGIKTPPDLMATMDPATKYYVERADAPHTRRTSALIHRSFFRPLTRVRYELIGQDRALEELFKVLSIHSRQLSVTPIVVLLCGPSGHGKSLLARKFGSLLDVPTHTVNMTTLGSTQDLWKSYSMSPYETPTTCTLAEFLVNNEGKRCVVVLDEIEKTPDEKTLWSLLMPWELGRCAFEANGRHVDVRNVVWLGTSNVGHDLVFEHHEARATSDELMSRGEYVDLMGLLRPRVSERLGASILSRVTTVLPFVPFTLEERRAICCEALHTIAGDIVRTLPSDVVDSMVDGALGDYIAAEGARSLYRAVSNQLVDNI